MQEKTQPDWCSSYQPSLSFCVTSEKDIGKTAGCTTGSDPSAIGHPRIRWREESASEHSIAVVVPDGRCLSTATYTSTKINPLSVNVLSTHSQHHVTSLLPASSYPSTNFFTTAIGRSM